MIKYLYYLRLQFKSALQLLPKLFVGTLLFAFLAALIGYAGTKTLYNSNRLFFFKVAAILPEDDAMVEMGYNMLMEMGNLENFCEIVNTTEKEALDMLEKGEIYCAIYIPENFVNDVLNGVNTPAKIILPDNAGLETIAFKSVLNAGASSLAYAQAGIYAVSDVYYLYDLDGEYDEVNEAINMDYIRFVFNRGSFNKITTLESTEVLSLTQFYVCCGLTLLMLFLGLTLGGFIKQESKTTTMMLNRNGLSSAYSVICKTVVITLTQGALLIILLLVAKLGVHIFASYEVEKMLRNTFFAITPANMGILLLCEFLATSFIICVYEVAGTGLYGMLLLFALNCVMMFASGLILPSAYLPGFLRGLGNLLPTAALKDMITAMFTGSVEGKSLTLLLIYVVIFTVISTICKHLYKES